MMKRLQLLILVFFPTLLLAQNKATIYGTVKDSLGNKVIGASVTIVNTGLGISTDTLGRYILKIPADTSVQLLASFIGYKSQEKTVNLKRGQKRKINFILEKSGIALSKFVITDQSQRNGTMQRINPLLINKIPSPNGSIEDIIKTLPGVTSNNELSSQYNVRGGNYDENLVYVNGIEVYRPMLVQSGQQEGLSFINSDLVSSVNFSAGGFAAKYGDKMSSVLAVTYKKPIKFAGSGTFSLQGGNLHVEGSSKAHRFTYLSGLRYKSNQYVLGSLDTKGDYKPHFLDFQNYFTYDLTEKWQLAFLGTAASNVYNFIPQDRKTSFGTINQAKQLQVYFDGQEKDAFNTYFGALSSTWNPNAKNEIQLNLASYLSNEDVTYDIDGEYYINELENDLGSKNFGQTTYTDGIGSYLRHARDYLNAWVSNIQLKGTSHVKKHKIEYGAKLQHEVIADQQNEWYLIDSAGFSIPHPVDSVGYTDPTAQPKQELNLNSSFKSNNNLQSNRLEGYVQDEYGFKLRDTSKITLTYGIRANYWTLNRQTVVSPRATIAFKPYWKHDWVFRFSTGYYYQPPFYKELIDVYGNLNKNVKAQRAIHFVLGGDYNFKAWGRPFKLLASAYYKKLDFLNPYEIDNVRIRYFGENNAKGYAAGIDGKVGGQFVKNIDSWLSVSLLQTKADLSNDAYTTYYNSDSEQIIPGYTYNNVPVDSVVHHPGYIPRPSDQLVNVALYFQDYLPKLPSFQMHLTLFYGSGLPFGPPTFDRYKDTLRMPPYERVDIGFSYEILGKNHKWRNKKNPLHYFRNIWLDVEVFNLLQINNTISYLWITDVTGRRYAIPNYLTSRQLNFKLHFEF